MWTLPLAPLRSSFSPRNYNLITLLLCFAPKPKTGTRNLQGRGVHMSWLDKRTGDLSVDQRQPCTHIIHPVPEAPPNWDNLFHSLTSLPQLPHCPQNRAGIFTLFPRPQSRSRSTVESVRTSHEKRKENCSFEPYKEGH